MSLGSLNIIIGSNTGYLYGFKLLTVYTTPQLANSFLNRKL